MTITVYAILKEHFSKQFTLSENCSNILELRNILISRKPEAEGILKISRFAIDNEFVDNNYTLDGNEQISIMPPSSGG